MNFQKQLFVGFIAIMLSGCLGSLAEDSITSNPLLQPGVPDELSFCVQKAKYYQERYDQDRYIMQGGMIELYNCVSILASVYNNSKFCDYSPRFEDSGCFGNFCSTSYSYPYNKEKCLKDIKNPDFANMILFNYVIAPNCHGTPDAAGCAILKLAINRGFMDVNSRSTNVHYPNATPLIVAAAWDNSELVKYLLEHGADVNARDANGKTALMAVRSADIVSLLISNGADVNASDNKGRSVLSHYVEQCPRDSTIVLIRNGADVNSKDALNRSVLWYALDCGRFYQEDQTDPEYLELLIRNGADVNSKDINGESILEQAKYFQGNGSTYSLLVEAGAKEDESNISQKT